MNVKVKKKLAKLNYIKMIFKFVVLNVVLGENTNFKAKPTFEV